jgi:predicted alpha/beta hydrolase family esterase
MAHEVLILHGWQNHRPDGHWQRWLADELTLGGSRVRYPQLPEADAPVLDDWIDHLDAELEGSDPDSLVVVAHSLGCLLWLAYVARRAARGEMGRLAKRVLFVAPASARVLRGIPEIAAFAPDEEIEWARQALTATAAERGVVVGSADDPFCPEGAEHAYAAPLGLEYVAVEAGGHLTPDDGFGSFPIVLDLATR